MNNENSASSSNQPENQQKWSHLVMRAQTDERLRQQLLSDPAPILQNEGFEIPEGTLVRVVQGNGHLECVVELPRPAATELTAEELSGVAGGGAKGASTKTQTQSGKGQEFITYTMTEVFISSY
jgi:hypothetical protein